MSLDVLLELSVKFRLSVLVADPDILRTVITYDTAPQCVVHV